MRSIDSRRNLNAVDLISSQIIDIQHLTTRQELFHDPAVQNKRGNQIIHCVGQTSQVQLQYTIER